MLATSQPLSVRDLSCEHLRDPIGIPVLAPRLSWTLRSTQRDVAQTAYQLRVAEDPRQLARGRRLWWDSGRVASGQSVLVPYGGPPVRPRQRLYWQVRVWDNHGNASAWSEAAFWETGLGGPADWQAQWIAAPWEENKTTSSPCPMFRTTFAVNGRVTRARAYLTSRGLYEAELNGMRIGDQVFTPGWTSYNKRLQYQVYDITDQLVPGANAIGVTLGDGWYRGFIGWSTQRNFYGDQLALLAQLEITYADGRTQVVRSGPDWRAATGPIRAADLYNGEVYDARRARPAWSTAAFDDSGWETARRADFPLDNLVPAVSAPVRRVEERAPAAILTTPKGELVYDFGQNLTGRVRLRVQGPAGATVTLHHAEVLDRDGNFYTANLRNAKQELKYTLRGEGEEHYEPHFTFMGFRYVRVEGLPSPPRPEHLTAVVIHSDMEAAGTFTCSDSLINRLQENIRWGQRGNFLDVPTDCPQRDERMGWTGDAQAFSRTAAFNYDVAAFFTKWLQDLAADQYPDGRVPFVIPHVLGKDNVASAGWADAATIIPWNMYLAYGDTAFLARQYPSMKAWVDFMAGQAGDSYLWNRGFHFGDWLFYSVNDDRDGRSAITDKYYIAQAFFAHSTDLLHRAATVLGRDDEARRYADLRDKVTDAFRREYLTPGGRLVSNTQTAYVLALTFDLLPEDQRADAAARLAENIRAYGHLTTGFLGTPYLCHALTRFGYADLAYQLLERREYPSWLYPVTQGATTIWERWDGQRPDGTFQEVSMNSFNHYAYGAIGDWLYRSVAGIDIDEARPGYRHVILSPLPGGTLSHARASHNGPYGEISSGWTLAADGLLTIEVTVPPNTTATVRLPEARLADVREGNTPVATATGVHRPRQEGNAVVLNAGSGTYRFVYTRHK